jgi:hypothetical protein
MPKDRFIVTAGPTQTAAGDLFVSFVEPAKDHADTFYTDSREEAAQKIKAAYPKDRLCFHPPRADAANAAEITNKASDRLYAQLVELCAAPFFENIDDLDVFLAMCRAGEAFVDAPRAPTLFVAGVTGARIERAEVALADVNDEDLGGFTFFPGRGAFDVMQKHAGSLASIDGVLAFRVMALPDWIAAAAQAIGRKPVYPEPSIVSEGERLGLDDVDASMIAATALAVAQGGAATVNGVGVTLTPWEAT